MTPSSLALLVVGLVVLLFGVTAFTGAPYVPSRRRDVRRALRTLHPLSRDDVVVDIGSGGGVVLREAAALGARAVGFEINPVLVFISRVASRGNPAISVRLANFWTTRLPDDVTVVYTFGEGRDIDKMAARVQYEATRLGRSITFISYAFELRNTKPVACDHSYFVYLLKPLQTDKA